LGVEKRTQAAREHDEETYLFKDAFHISQSVP